MVLGQVRFALLFRQAIDCWMRCGLVPDSTSIVCAGGEKHHRLTSGYHIASGLHFYEAAAQGWSALDYPTWQILAFDGIFMESMAEP